MAQSAAQGPARKDDALDAPLNALESNAVQTGVEIQVGAESAGQVRYAIQQGNALSALYPLQAASLNLELPGHLMQLIPMDNLPMEIIGLQVL